MIGIASVASQNNIVLNQPACFLAYGPILNGWDPYCEVYKVVFARAEANGQEILRHCSVPVGEVLGVDLNGAHLTKRKMKHCKGSVILVNDERSATLSDKAERPEKKR